MTVIRIETTITGPSTGGNYMSVQHFRVSSDPSDPGTLATQAGAMQDTLEVLWDTLKTIMGSTATITIGTKCVTVDRDPNVEVGISSSTPKSGVQTDAYLPWASQGIIRLNTGLAERGGKGRLFIPYITELSNANGTWTTAQRSAVASAASSWRSAASTSDTALVVWHRGSGTASDVLSTSVPDYWAVLRGRRD